MKFQLSNKERIRAVTDPAVNRSIDRAIEENIRKYTYQGSKEISQRIEELEKEWDVERVLQIGAASAALLGIGFSFNNRKWFILPTLALSFLVINSLKGWAPPIPLLRRLGFRTKQEIDSEIFAMKHLRGDFTEFEKAGKRDAELTIKEAMVAAKY
jgi:hypothetical protein